MKRKPTTADFLAARIERQQEKGISTQTVAGVPTLGSGLACPRS